MDDTELDVNQKLFFNGLSANGEYLTQPLTAAELSDVARGLARARTPDEELWLKEIKARNNAGSDFSLLPDIDPCKLEECGWGMILPLVKRGTPEDTEQQQIVEALQPLLDWRKEQATKLNEQYFQVFRYERGYRPGDNKQKFLARLGAAAGPVDPKKGVPYYLLIVGSPQVIPYSVQYQIDVQYAVGRIHFETLIEYANYARSVVAAEKGGLLLSKDVAFLGVANPDDRATQLSRKHLVGPLAEMVENKVPAGWNVQRYFDENATRENLEQLLGGGVPAPALLFTGSHGMGFPKGDLRQQRQQGALVCQNWPGRENWKQPIKEDFYFSADHLRSDANLLGMIAFNFACYSGGTPQLDEFSKQASKARLPIAPAAFVSGLHRKMLGLEKGGALAAIGHVERAWGSSFMAGTGALGAQAPQLAAFTSTMTNLLKGMPVGAALEYFNQRYAELASDLTVAIEEAENGTDIDAYGLANLWTSNNDARGYAITGDPAVRMQVSGTGETRTREVIVVSSYGPGGTVVPAPAATPPPPAVAAVEFATALPLKTPPATESATATPVRKSPAAGVATSFATGGASGFQQLVDKVVSTLVGAVQDLTRLEVRTYSSSDVNTTASQSRDVLAQAGQLRAFTRIMIDGDIDAVVPEHNGAIDTQLWGLHLELVKHAQTHRAEMIKTLIGIVKGT